MYNLDLLSLGVVAFAYTTLAAREFGLLPVQVLLFGAIRRFENAPNMVALTFDDGPAPKFTAQILDILDTYEVKATFFVVGTMVEEYPATLTEIQNRGHLIGNHSYHHKRQCFRGSRSLEADLDRSIDVLRKHQVETSWFRTPWSMQGPLVSRFLKQRAMTNVVASNVPRDWSAASQRDIVRRTLKNLKGGDVILLHDGGGNRTETVAALGPLIEGIRERGFELGTLDAMDSGGVPPKVDDWATKANTAG